MHRTRLLALLPLAFGAAAARAQFDGPAPLAWRWQGFSRTLSGGTPLVRGDQILTALGNRIYALDRTSGNQIWRFPVADPIEGSFRTTPLLVDGVLVAAADNKSVYGVDPDSGALKWIYQAPLPILGNPVITANGKSIAFVMQGGKQLQVVSAATGEASYSAPLLLTAGVAGQIAGYGDEIIYFSQDNRLTAIAAGTQKRIWSKTFTVLPTLPQPIIQGETLYTYSGQYLVALSAAGGTPRYQARLTEQPFSAPIIGASGALVLTNTGKAYFYDTSGNLKTPKPIDIGSQPIVAGTAVGAKFLVPTVNGALNLVDPVKGTIDWSFVVRPGSPEAATPANGGGLGGPAGGPGGAGGIGGFGGGQGGRGGQGGPSGGGGIGRTDAAPTAILSIQASAPVALAGTTLLVPARDGSLLAFDREIGVDLTPPEVRLAWPTPGEDVNGQAPLEMIFKIEDEASGLKLDTLTLQIDSVPYETQFTKEGFLVARITSSGKNKPLANGRHTLTVTAQDWLGNEAKRTFALNVDNTLRPLVRPTTANPNNPGGPGAPGGRGGGGFGGGPGGDGGR